MNPTPFWKF